MPASSQQQPPTPPQRSPLVREMFISAIIVLIAVLLRAKPLGQSLWYDEMHTLGMYVSQPWSQIVKGQYSPNNHILFTLLAKTITPEAGDIADITILSRLPSLIAGRLARIAITLPLHL